MKINGRPAFVRDSEMIVCRLNANGKFGNSVVPVKDTNTRVVELNTTVGAAFVLKPLPLR